MIATDRLRGSTYR